MSLLSEEVSNRIRQIDEEINFFKKRRKKNIEGHIRVSKDDGRNRYYYVTSDNGPAGRYLKRSERELAGAIIQNDYEASALKSLYDERKVLLKLQEIYRHGSGHFFTDRRNESGKILRKGGNSCLFL